MLSILVSQPLVVSSSSIRMPVLPVEFYKNNSKALMNSYLCNFPLKKLMKVVFKQYFPTQICQTVWMHSFLFQKHQARDFSSCHLKCSIVPIICKLHIPGDFPAVVHIQITSTTCHSRQQVNLFEGEVGWLDVRLCVSNAWGGYKVSSFHPPVAPVSSPLGGTADYLVCQWCSVVAIFHLFPSLSGPISEEALIIHWKLRLFPLPSN